MNNRAKSRYAILNSHVGQSDSGPNESFPCELYETYSSDNFIENMPKIDQK